MSDAFSDAYRYDYRPTWHLTTREERERTRLSNQCRILQQKIDALSGDPKTEKQAANRAIAKFRLQKKVDVIVDAIELLTKNKWY